MTKVTFQCKRSGNFVSFSNENDIAGMRKHEGYKEINDAQASETVKAVSLEAPTKEVLKRGRPVKSTMPSFLQE